MARLREGTEMARSLWTGSINFGLVNVPVKAFTAVRDHDVHFHQLDKKSGSRIRYRKVAEDTGKEVDADNIALGYEVRGGRYVTFDEQEMKALRPTSSKVIEVSDFVDLDEIDPIYYENTYWLVPDGEAAKKSYQLLVAAMEDEQRVGIGTVVLRDRQHLSAVRPLDGVLAMSTMRFADEVRPAFRHRGSARGARQGRPKGIEDGQADHRRPGVGVGPKAIPRHLHRRPAQANRCQDLRQGSSRGRRGAQGSRPRLDGSPRS